MEVQNMFKADLKQLWGSYCDTDKLVDDVIALLTKYNHDNTEHGVCTMLHTYFTNKKSLIDMFVKSKNYIGNMRICVDTELERRNEQSEIISFCKYFPKNVDAKEAFLVYVDENGKTFDDYVRIGITKFKASDLHYGNIAERLGLNQEARRKFNYEDKATIESHANLDSFNRIIRLFGGNPQSVLHNDLAYTLTQYKMNATFVSGMKTFLEYVT